MKPIQTYGVSEHSIQEVSKSVDADARIRLSFLGSFVEARRPRKMLKENRPVS